MLFNPKRTIAKAIALAALVAFSAEACLWAAPLNGLSSVRAAETGALKKLRPAKGGTQNLPYEVSALKDALRAVVGKVFFLSLPALFSKKTRGDTFPYHEKGLAFHKGIFGVYDAALAALGAVGRTNMLFYIAANGVGAACSHFVGANWEASIPRAKEYARICNRYGQILICRPAAPAQSALRPVRSHEKKGPGAFLGTVSRSLRPVRAIEQDKMGRQQTAPPTVKGAVLRFSKENIGWVIAGTILITAAFAFAVNMWFPFILSSVPYYINTTIYFSAGELLSQAFARLKGEQRGIDLKKIAIAGIVYGTLFGFLWSWYYDCYINIVPNTAVLGKFLWVYIDQTAGAVSSVLWPFFVSSIYDNIADRDSGQALTWKNMPDILKRGWRERNANFLKTIIWCWIIWIPIQAFNLNRPATPNEMVNFISVIEMPWSVLWVYLANLKGGAGLSENLPRSVVGFGLGAFAGFFALHGAILYYMLGITVGLSVLTASVTAFGLLGLLIANINSLADLSQNAAVKVRRALKTARAAHFRSKHRRVLPERPARKPDAAARSI